MRDTKVKVRSSNFELLRFISMLLIVLFHMVVHGGAKDISSYTFSNFVYSFFYSAGKLGDVLFIMITGYFMINKDVSIKKLARLEGQVLFYSIIYLIIFSFFDSGISGKDIARSIFPNMTNAYWFFSSYFALMFFVPFINKFVKGLNKKDFRKLLVIGFVFMILIPSLIIYNEDISKGIYLVYYYLVGGYIGLHLKDVKFNKGILLGVSIFVYCCITMSALVFSNLASVNPGLAGLKYSFSDLSSIFIFVCSVCLFMFFKDLNIKNSKIINWLGGVSFGVYLFHENIFMKPFLWKDLFNISSYYNASYFLIYALGIAILVYLVGGVVETIRRKIMDDRVFPVVWYKFNNLDIVSKIKKINW